MSDPPDFSALRVTPGFWDLVKGMRELVGRLPKPEAARDAPAGEVPSAEVMRQHWVTDPQGSLAKLYHDED